MKQNTRLALLIAVLGLMCLVLSACGTTGHVAMMHDVAGDVDTSGQNPVCTFEIFKSIEIDGPIADRVSIRYLHQSWCFVGKPFNDRPESTLDAIGVDVRIW